MTQMSGKCHLCGASGVEFGIALDQNSVGRLICWDRDACDARVRVAAAQRRREYYESRIRKRNSRE